MSDNSQDNMKDQDEQQGAGAESQMGMANLAEEISHHLVEKPPTQKASQTRIVEPSLPEASPDPSSGNLGMLMGVNLNLTVELGRTNMSVRQVLDLQKGAVVELDRIAGEAVDVFVNERLIARGDVVVVDDKFGVRITELVSPNPVG